MHYNIKVLVVWKVSDKNENVVNIYLHRKNIFLEVVNKTLLEYGFTRKYYVYVFYFKM